MLSRSLPSAALRLGSRSVITPLSSQRRELGGLPTPLQPLFQYASECNITVAIQAAMEAAHSSGLSWGVTVVATGITLRLLTAPAHIMAERIFAKRLHATNWFSQKILEKLAKKYKVGVGPNPTNTALELRTDNLEIQQNVTKILIPSVQIALRDQGLQASRIQSLKMVSVPVWMFSSFALRNIISGDFHPSIPGALWVPDLLVPDPYFIIPLTVGAFGFLNLWSQRKIYPALSGAPTRTKVYDAGLIFFTTLATYIMIHMPACIPLYWLTVSVTGFAQAQLLRHPGVKKVLGINRLPTDSRTPIRDLFLTRAQGPLGTPTAILPKAK